MFCAVLQQLQLISEALKALVAESSQHQSLMNQLEAELSSVKRDYDDLKEDVENLGINSPGECVSRSELLAESSLSKEKTDKCDPPPTEHY